MPTRPILTPTPPEANLPTGFGLRRLELSIARAPMSYSRDLMD